MDAAKSAVNKIIGRSGHHDTEVDEHVNTAVTNENIRPHRHEETQQAIDREVHQDHYHTTVQPLQHKEVLPEKHTHQMMPTQEREVHHGDSDKIRTGFQSESAQFRDNTRTHETTHTSAQAATATGEHVHHHVHETVQPVINKDTIAPEVVHTTVPIHETHHAQAEHHGLSTLPVKTLDEFKKMGGTVTGATHRHEEYEGHPRPYNPEMQTGSNVGGGLTGSHGTHGTHSGTGLTGTHGTHSSGTGLTGHDSDRGLTGGHSSGTGLTGGHSSGTGLTGGHSSGTGLTGGHSSGTGLTGGHSSGTGLTGSHNTHGTGVDARSAAGEVLSGTHGSGTTGHQSSHSGLTGTDGLPGRGTSGATGTTGTHVSGIGGEHSSGTGLSSSGAGSTGTALGGRTEGNTAGRALDAATGHGSTGVGHSHHDTAGGIGSGSTGTSGVGSGTTSGHGLDHSSTTGHSHTTGSTTHHDRDLTDNSSSTNTRHTGDATGSKLSEVQSPQQGKDPNLVETNTQSSNWKGEGAPGSHSAVFGLTPDGKKHDDTQHGHGSLKPAHTKESSNTGSGDMGSRSGGSGHVADQMQQSRISDRGPESSLSDTGSTTKPGAGGSLGGSQGFGQVRPQDHGSSGKMTDKLDPTTDADNDGKRGVMD